MKCLSSHCVRRLGRLNKINDQLQNKNNAQPPIKCIYLIIYYLEIEVFLLKKKCKKKKYTSTDIKFVFIFFRHDHTHDYLLLSSSIEVLSIICCVILIYALVI